MRTKPGRLLHLNGPPGVGKSTMAARYAADHPGTLCLEIDALRTFVGGWQEDFAGAGALVRTAALAMITAYLAGGHDVVLPQLVADPVELARFERAATDGGGELVELMLWAELSESLRRFRERPVRQPWQQLVAETVTTQGDTGLRAFHAALAELTRTRPGVLVVLSRQGEQEATYAAVLAALGAPRA